MGKEPKGLTLTSKEFRKEMEEWAADFEKRMKALKLEPKATNEAKKKFMMSQEQLRKFVEKTYPDDKIPLKQLKPVVKKETKGWLKYLHVKPAKGATPTDADGVKFTFGTKRFSLGAKLKYDSKKEVFKLEPTGGATFKF